MERPCFLVNESALERLRRRLVEDGDRLGPLSELCACHRINALGAIVSAGRGWPGASLSCAEILTVLYHAVVRSSADPRARDAVVLGKGHAAAMQYACLAGVGLLPVAELLRYQRAGGPQAHADRSTPGIDVNTGSLGQALSKCCGLALARPERRVFAILGDGELQEGQCFEALQTMAHRGLGNVTVVIDRNHIQTDSPVEHIKAIRDLAAVLRGFGLRVRTLDGNDLAEVHACLTDPALAARPTAVIADTAKGAGVSFMASRGCEPRAYRYHGGAPAPREYLAALEELGRRISDAEVRRDVDEFIARERPRVRRDTIPARPSPSTGDAFARALTERVARRDDLVVLDADLESACRLTELGLRFPERFLEMGISEQDMVSCAGGLALGGELPVVNTYAAFLRRAYEQIYVNATEGTRIIYAGHYAGLCYATDGKTHQCTGDVAMMRAIPQMTVLYPAFVEEVAGMLDWYLAGGGAGPLYLRLHRTPAASVPEPAEPPRFVPGRGLRVRDRGARTAILTSGPHLTSTCAEVADELGFDLWAVSTLRGLAPELAAELTGRYDDLLVVEELMRAGGLLDELCAALARLDPSPRPRLRHHAVDGFTFSTLEPGGLYRSFGLDRAALIAALQHGLDE